MHQVLLLHEGYLHLCSDLFCRSYIAIKLHANENNALSDFMKTKIICYSHDIVLIFHMPMAFLL